MHWLGKRLESMSGSSNYMRLVEFFVLGFMAALRLEECNAKDIDQGKGTIRQKSISSLGLFSKTFE
jgi:hypothetical protein